MMNLTAQLTLAAFSLALLAQPGAASVNRISIPGGGLKRTVNGTVERLTVIPDHQGGARLVLNGATVVEKLSYEPYGRTLEDTPDSTKTTRKYTGQEKDDSTSLYNYNARLYDPAAGLFISADTIIPNPVSPHTWNRYAYCHGDPVNLIDPSGHDAGPKGPGGHTQISSGYWPAWRSPEKFWKDIDPACTTKALDASHGSDAPFGDDPYGMPFPPKTPFQDAFSWCVAELPYAERSAVMDRYEATPERQRMAYTVMYRRASMHELLILHSDDLIGNAPQMMVGVAGVVVAGAKMVQQVLSKDVTLHGDIPTTLPANARDALTKLEADLNSCMDPTVCGSKLTATMQSAGEVVDQVVNDSSKGLGLGTYKRCLGCNGFDDCGRYRSAADELGSIYDIVPGMIIGRRQEVLDALNKLPAIPE